VRSVLEGSSVLRSIEGKFDLSVISVGNVEYGILSVDGSVSVVVGIDKASIRSGHIGITVLNGGNVVSKSKNANAGIVVNAVRKVLKLGHGHVVSVSKSIGSVTEVVLSRPGDLSAIGGRDSVSGCLHPGLSGRSASGGGRFSSLDFDVSSVGLRISAISLSLNVLRF